MKKLDQKEVNSLFQSAMETDTNAELALSLLQDDGFDLSNLHMQKQDKYTDFDEVSRRFTERSTKNLTSGLNLYLLAVHFGSFKTADFLMSRTEHETSYSYHSRSNTFMHSAGEDAGLIPFRRADDIALAIMSPVEDALPQLLKLKEKYGHEVDVNKAFSLPDNTREFKGKKNKALKPLDIAVMKYVSTKLYNEHVQQEIAATAANIVEEYGEDVIQAAKNKEDPDEKIIIAPHFDPEDVKNLTPKDTNDEEIKTLIAYGAAGSEAVYLPATDSASVMPFGPFGQSHYEVMSLQEFCERNEALFEPELFELLIDNEVDHAYKAEYPELHSFG